jgi:hypothetical protein
VTVSLTSFGFGVSVPFNLCNNRVIGVLNGSNGLDNNYYDEWQGNTSNIPGIGAVVETRTPRGTGDAFQPTMWINICKSILLGTICDDIPRVGGNPV